MKKLTLESKAFQQILQNLRLENLNLPLPLQNKVIELVNVEVEIAPNLLKGILRYREI
ncbi:Zn-dependent hydrolase [Bacillus sp. FJAT-42315]|uniref:Zn-dependent hydrolase n=1 Tax=Bacillus sp. FJAT-42315 TaxID=2014077 RepID=UPI000C2476F8|nr:Zn-dependent hydrolase [Bacillus sp. FJAT-42315]